MDVAACLKSACYLVFNSQIIASSYYIAKFTNSVGHRILVMWVKQNVLFDLVLWGVDHVAHNSKKGQISFLHEVFNCIAHCFLAKALKQFLRGDNRNCQPNYSTCLGASLHVVVFVVPVENTSNSKFKSYFLIEFYWRKPVKKLGTYWRKLREPIIGFFVLVLPLGIFQAWIEVVCIQNNRSSEEIS